MELVSSRVNMIVGDILKATFFKNRLAFFILAVIATSSLFVGCSVAERISNGVETSGCRAGSQRLINWDQKPQLENGYLMMSGTTKDDTRIHDPVSARTGTNWPAFVLNDLEEVSDDALRLVAVGNIYPREMRDRLPSLSRGGRPRLLAEKYDVSATSFDVRVKIPDSLLPYNLVVSVWGANPSASSRAIGAECVN